MLRLLSESAGSIVTCLAGRTKELVGSSPDYAFACGFDVTAVASRVARPVADRCF